MSWTITRKVGVGIGSMLLLGASLVLLVHRGTSGISGDLDRITSATLRSEAAYELEINVNETSLSVLKYLETGDPAFRNLLTQDANEFARFADAYEEAADTTERRMLREVQMLFQSYLNTGKRLMDNRDREEEQFGFAQQRLRVMESLLNERLKTIVGTDTIAVLKTRDLLSLEAALDHLRSEFSLASKAVKHTEATALMSASHRLREDLKRVGSLDSFHESRAFFEALDHDLDAIGESLRATVDLVRSRLSNNSRFLDLRTQLDSLLDNHIQVHARKNASTAVEEVSSSLWSTRVTLLSFSLASLGVGLIATTLISRSVLGPIKRLVEGVRALRLGKLEHRIGTTPQGEIGELITAFDDMAESREKAETTLHAQAEALKGMNENLERLARERLAALEKTQAQFRQAQKMEAIGRLAGGVAHDFNNMLSVILGYGESLLTGIKPGEPFREEVGEIFASAERAAQLTRQLLTFSRKQVVDPKVFDVNDAVRGIERMLRRLIGEDVQLGTSLAPESVYVKMDPGHFEQVLMNLAVNARDAMPKGGRLLLETTTIDVDANKAEGQGQPPGKYALVAVTDTGTGMDKETIGHLFEPFFTTKPLGKGTGLGLSTVYGIVKQAGGHVGVYSEPGKGTTFKVYLPITQKTDVGPRPLTKEASPSGGSETILVVEDADSVRKLACAALRKNGYSVIEAANGEEAIDRASSFPGRIHLVLTDSVMPGLSGREVIQKLRIARPDSLFLMASGFTAEAVLLQGEVELGMPFLEKPFTPSTLARKVREVLDSPKAIKS